MSDLNKHNPIFTREDIRYMQQAIKLAEKGRGNTNPNPMVGAIIVKDGKVISSGYHKQAGLAHAEIEAINNSSKSLENSTMYVTLEPCTFEGKTLPCVNKIVKHKFKEIIIGCIDPNPRVNGRGINFLKKAGIKVKVGLLRDKIELQNEVFFKQIKMRIPFICCKIASSIDGKLATKSSDSKWITSEESRMQVQNLRREHDCILTGINTILNDDPYLLPRKTLDGPFKNTCMTLNRKFHRAILDSNLRISLDSNIIKTSNLAKTIIFTGRKNDLKFTGKVKKLQENDIDVLAASQDLQEDTGLNIPKILKILYQKYKITSILLECGPALLGSFLKRDLIDKFIFYFAPKIIGGDSDYDMFPGLGIDKMKDSINLRFENIKRIGKDIIVTAYPSKK